MWPSGFGWGAAGDRTALSGLGVSGEQLQVFGSKRCRSVKKLDSGLGVAKCSLCRPDSSALCTWYLPVSSGDYVDVRGGSVDEGIGVARPLGRSKVNCKVKHVCS